MDSFKTLNFDESDVFLPTNIEAIDSILGKLDLFPHINSTGMEIPLVLTRQLTNRNFKKNLVKTQLVATEELPFNVFSSPDTINARAFSYLTGNGFFQTDASA